MDIILPLLVGILVWSLFMLTWNVAHVLVEFVEHRKH